MKELEVLRNWNYAIPLMKRPRTLIKQSIKHHGLLPSDIKRFYLMLQINQ